MEGVERVPAETCLASLALKGSGVVGRRARAQEPAVQVAQPVCCRQLGSADRQQSRRQEEQSGVDRYNI